MVKVEFVKIDVNEKFLMSPVFRGKTGVKKEESLSEEMRVIFL